MKSSSEFTSHKAIGWGHQQTTRPGAKCSERFPRTLGARRDKKLFEHKDCTQLTWGWVQTMARVGLFFFVSLGSGTPPFRPRTRQGLRFGGDNKTYTSWQRRKTSGLRVRVLLAWSRSKAALGRVWMGSGTPSSPQCRFTARGARATSTLQPCLGQRVPWKNPEWVSIVTAGNSTRK